MDRRHFRRCLALPTLLFASACGAIRPHQEETPEPEGGGFDVEHYALTLELEPEERRISGAAEVRFFATRSGLVSCVLDLKGLDVTGVTDDLGNELSFVHEGGSLTVDLAHPLEVGDLGQIRVAYGGTPASGLWFSGERFDGTGPTQVFTHGQPEHASGWFPCVDQPSDRATFDLAVTMPATWIAVAGGERLDRVEDSAAGTATERWRMTTPHSTYLASLVAGEFVMRTRDWDGVPISFLAEPHYEDWIEASFHDTDEILSFLSDYTGIRYPYAKYSQAAVANFPWGGMENITATTLTPLTLDDAVGQRDATSTALIVHEAAHQWFGNLVTCETWEHLWLNEGFASYFEYLYDEHVHGQDEMRVKVRNAQDQYIDGDKGRERRPIVWNVYREPEDLFTVHPYQGAAVRLHLLRFVVGDDVFREGVRTYLAEFAGENVVTADLRRTFEKVSGRDLGRFFEQWFESPGYPEFRTEWEWDERKGEIVFEVRQIHDVKSGTPPAFSVPVDLEVLDETGTRSHRIEVSKRKERFRLPAGSRPYYVRFDKGGWIPKGMRWDRSPSAWLAISGSDDDVNGRRDAMRALGALAEADRTNEPEAHETFVVELVDRLRRDPSSHVRVDAALALGRAGGIEALARLQEAAQSQPDARVRVAALTALRFFGPSAELATLGRRAFEEGYSWRTMGAAAGLVCSADPHGAFGWLTSKLFIDSPHDQLSGELLGHLGSLGHPGVNDQLLGWAVDEALHPTARAVAVHELARQEAHKGTNGRALRDMLGQENFRLSEAVVEALARIDTEFTKDALEDYYPRARTSDERRTIERALIGRRL